jgi:CRISPR-associated protein (TIGR02584 family)
VAVCLVGLSPAVVTETLHALAVERRPPILPDELHLIISTMQRSSGPGSLATREVDSSRHSGVIPLFQKHFVRTGVVEVTGAGALARAFEKRQKTDYADFATVTPGEAAEIRGEVEAFVAECARVLARLEAEEDR